MTEARGELELDPRFLVFEFMTSFMIRQQQVELIMACLRKVRSEEPLVRQMIMGAGKTAVVSPMVSLMIAHGKYLVVQALLHRRS